MTKITEFGIVTEVGSIDGVLNMMRNPDYRVNCFNEVSRRGFRGYEVTYNLRPTIGLGIIEQKKGTTPMFKFFLLTTLKALIKDNHGLAWETSTHINRIDNGKSFYTSKDGENAGIEMELDINQMNDMSEDELHWEVKDIMNAIDSHKG